MWNELWHSLGKATGHAARSIRAAPRPVPAAAEGQAPWKVRPALTGVVAAGQPDVPAQSEDEATGRLRRGTVRAGYAMALLALGAARLFGAASSVFRRRAVLIFPGMQVCLGALAQMLSSLGRPSASVAVAVAEQAEGVALILHERDIAPGRIGIDGIPGSGKSTLARALAGKLDMEWKSLDFRNLGLPEDLAEERTIYEHHRLFRTRDVDTFDVLVYIDEPVRSSKARVRRRGRGLILGIMLDYDKLKKIGKMAFDACDGEAIAIPNSHLLVKTKPPGGFRAVENIAGRLERSGVYASGASKEQMLCLLACGKRQEGLRAYLLPLEYIARLGSLAARLRAAGRRFVAALCAKGSANGTGRAAKTASLADALLD